MRDTIDGVNRALWLEISKTLCQAVVRHGPLPIIPICPLTAEKCNHGNGRVCRYRMHGHGRSGHANFYQLKTCPKQKGL
jgi:hypothetical protein